MRNTAKQTTPSPSCVALDRQRRSEGPAPAIEASAVLTTPEMDSQMS